MAPYLAELFKAFLAHKHNNYLSFLFKDVLKDLLIDLIDKDLLIDVILCLGSFELGHFKHLLVNRVVCTCL